MAGESIPSISDLFGLNSPRGLLNVGNSQSNGLCTPPASSLYFQVRSQNAYHYFRRNYFVFL